jgi:hypothetical protein
MGHVSGEIALPPGTGRDGVNYKHESISMWTTASRGRIDPTENSTAQQFNRERVEQPHPRRVVGDTTH